MNREPPIPITEAEVATYARDGAVALRRHPGGGEEKGEHRDGASASGLRSPHLARSEIHGL